MKNNFYTVIGYNLTDMVVDRSILDDKELHDTWTNSFIRIWDDHEHNHFILGSLVSLSNDFSSPQSLSFTQCHKLHPYIDEKLLDLENLGVVKINIYNLPDYEIISFYE